MIHTVFPLAETRAVRDWSRQTYRVHQRLAMMWPDGEADERMLWRLEGPALLVQTHAPIPDPASIETRFALLAGEPVVSEWYPSDDVAQGATYSIDAVLAPSRTTGSQRRGIESLEGAGLWWGQHEPRWGMRALDLDVTRPRSEVIRERRERRGRGALVSTRARYRARVVCTDAELFAAAVTGGVGPGKAWGRGLLMYETVG